MWIQSSDDDNSPIYCDFCRKMIEQEDYGRHWPTCKAAALNAKKTQTQPAPQSHSQPAELQNSGDSEGQNEEGETYNCPTCGQTVALVSIENHMSTCRQLLVECSYCKANFPALEIEEHESSCDSNHGLIGQLNPQMLQLLASMANNANGNGNRSNRSNGNPMMDLRSLLGGMGNGRRNNPMVDPTEELLQNSLFPALTKMDRGMKRRDLQQLPTEKFSKEVHREDKCTICLQEFVEGEEVMKIVCSHIQHASCYKEWLQHYSTCPLCKTAIKATPKQPA